MKKFGKTNAKNSKFLKNLFFIKEIIFSKVTICAFSLALTDRQRINFKNSIIMEIFNKKNW